MNWNNRAEKHLVEAVLALKSSDEARCFLRDLLTESEIKEFVGRLQTAVMLMQAIPYSAITKANGFSSTTIARVSRWLRKGEGGYETIISRLHHGEAISRGRGLR